jgi:hypothetical protein
VLPIDVSLVVQPEECAGLAGPSLSSWLYAGGLGALRLAARPYVAWKRKPRRRLRGLTPAPVAMPFY